jgi:hypothetical protein
LLRIDDNNLNMVNWPYEGTLILQSKFCPHLFLRRIEGGRDDPRPFITMDLERYYHACNHPLPTVNV